MRSLRVAGLVLGIASLAVTMWSCGSSSNGAAPPVTSRDAGGGDATMHPMGDGGPSPDAPSQDASTTDAFQPLPPTPATPELWYWHHSYLSPTAPNEPMHSEALIDQAVAAGYTGLALWDSSVTFLNKPGWDPTNLKAVVAYAVSKGLKVLPSTAPYGYSNDMLQTNPNLAEGTAIVGSTFKVVAGNGGNVLSLVNSLPAVQDGSFENGGAAWLKEGDACLSVDTTMGHGDSASAKLSATQSNCRLTYALTLTPSRLYHLQFWVQTQGFAQNSLNFELLDPGGVALITEPVTVQGSQGFTEVDFSFNSRSATAATLYLGIWGGFAGTLWVDDIVVEETALVNVLRRGGTPLSVHDANTTYTEGTDYAPISDPALAARPGNYDYWHTPPVVTIPAGSKLQPGAMVAIDHYTVIPSISGDVGVCLTEPAVQQWVHDNATSIAQVFPAGTGLFVSYDEMRHMNTCALCRSKNMDAGPLLAGNVQATWQTLMGVMPGAQGYTWNDMFDPNHNAVNDYYFVDGNIAGSWAGIPAGFIIMNWNLGKLAASLAWFSGSQAGQPHAFQQIIAGYYDSGDGTGAANTEMTAAMGIPGIVGAMYTTWLDDYSQLANYANAVKAAWPAYKASAP